MFSTTFVVKQNLFLCHRKKLAFRKKIITMELPPAKYACSDSYYSSLSYGVNLPVHSMYDPLWLHMEVSSMNNLMIPFSLGGIP